LKKKDYTAIVIVSLAIIVIVVFTIYVFNKKEKGQYMWVKTYQDGKVQPYDFGVFKALLNHKAGSDFELAGENLKDQLNTAIFEDSSTYVFVGRYAFLRRDEIDAMLQYANVGHQVVLIAEGLPDTMLQTLSYFAKPVHFNRFDDNSVTIETFREKSKSINHEFNFRSFDGDTTQKVDWYFLDEDQQLDYFFGETGNRYIKTGKINGRLNYAKFKVGRGFVYIHTSPVLLTNYALSKTNGYQYVDEIFSDIYTGKIIYDAYSREYKPDSESIQRKSDSPLSYILKQPALKWAWYLFLAAVLLFFLFKARRKQRIIPVLEQKRNTSIRFIETLSGLFYSDANHQKMAETKMNLFLFFLRNKLNVSTHDIDQNAVRLIALKSKVPEYDVWRIFDYYKQEIQKENAVVRSENLMEFYNRIDNFYHLYHSKK